MKHPAITPELRAAYLAAVPDVFRVCIDPDSGALRGYDLSVPMLIDDWVYASDGRIMVRIRARPEHLELDRPFGYSRRPDFARMFTGFNADYEYEPDPAPSPDLSYLGPCEKCNGSMAWPLDGERRSYESWEVYDEDGFCYECGSLNVEHFGDTLDLGSGVYIAVWLAKPLEPFAPRYYLPLDLEASMPIRFTADDGKGGRVEGRLMRCLNLIRRGENITP